MTPFTGPWLLLLVAAPLLGAAVVGRTADPRRARAVSVAAAGLALLIALGAAFASADAAPGAPRVDPLQLALLGAPRPLLGVDLLSGPLLVFVALVTLATVLGAPSASASPAALAGVLRVEAATLATFCSLHLGLLAVWWALALVPPWRTLRRAGAGRAARVFVLYQGLGCLALGAAVALIAATGRSLGLPAPLFLPELADSSASLPLVLPLIVVAVLAREGIAPLHSWVGAVVDASPPGLEAPLIVPRLGAYLLVRLLLLAFPGPFLEAVDVVAGLAIATAVYAAVVGLAQRDLRRALAWLATSQSALVLTGFECANAVGQAGALLLWLSVGLALTGLMLAAAAVEARCGRLDLKGSAGLAARTPILARAFLLLGLAGVGLPGTLGFVSEDLLFHGVLEAFPQVGVLIVVATAMNGFNVLRLYFAVFHGPPRAAPPVGDALPRERAALLALAALLVACGLAPAPLVELRGRVATVLARRVAR